MKNIICDFKKTAGKFILADDTYSAALTDGLRNTSARILSAGIKIQCSCAAEDICAEGAKTQDDSENLLIISNGGSGEALLLVTLGGFTDEAERNTAHDGGADYDYTAGFAGFTGYEDIAKAAESSANPKGVKPPQSIELTVYSDEAPANTVTCGFTSPIMLTLPPRSCATVKIIK